MGGINEPQGSMFSNLSPAQRVPREHPIRKIKEQVDTVLRRMTRIFDSMQSRAGRPSAPPERLLKAQIPIALCSVRSDRQLCGMLDYNILFQWFLDMNMEEASLDATTIGKNRDRLFEHIKRFEEIFGQLKKAGGLSKSQFRGRVPRESPALPAGTAYNPMRMSRLLAI